MPSRMTPSEVLAKFRQMEYARKWPIQQPAAPYQMQLVDNALPGPSARERMRQRLMADQYAADAAVRDRLAGREAGVPHVTARQIDRMNPHLNVPGPFSSMTDGALGPTAAGQYQGATSPAMVRDTNVTTPLDPLASAYVLDNDKRFAGTPAQRQRVTDKNRVQYLLDAIKAQQARADQMQAQQSILQGSPFRRIGNTSDYSQTRPQFYGAVYQQPLSADLEAQAALQGQRRAHMQAGGSQVNMAPLPATARRGAYGPAPTMAATYGMGEGKTDRERVNNAFQTAMTSKRMEEAILRNRNRARYNGAGSKYKAVGANGETLDQTPEQWLAANDPAAVPEPIAPSPAAQQMVLATLERMKIPGYKPGAAPPAKYGAMVSTPAMLPPPPQPRISFRSAGLLPQ